MRLWNDDVLKHTDAALELIAQAVSAYKATPLPARSARHPLLQGERLV